MAIISENTKGNKYHSEKDGKFVSSNNIEEKAEGSLSFESIDDFFGTLLEEKSPVLEFKNSKTVEEAEDVANAIFGGKKVCVFDKNHLFYANSIAKGLYDVHKDFPEVIEEIQHYTNDFSFIKKYHSSEEFRNYCRKELLSIYKKNELPTEALLEETVDKFAKKIFDFKNKSHWQKEGKYYSSYTGGTTYDDFKTIMFNGYTPASKLYEVFGKKDKEIHPQTQKKFNSFIGTAWHELGHIVSEYLFKRINEKEKQKISLIYFGAKVAEDITQYARTSYKEFISEAFLDHYQNGEEATESNREIFDYIKELYKKYVGN